MTRGADVTTEQPIEVRDMAIVHRAFRAAYDEAARRVEAESEPTPERVTFLADHVEMTLDLLHHHHEGEDELLWPLLLERVPEQAEMVQRVADQHDDVAAAVEHARIAVSTWRVSPQAAERGALAASLRGLNGVLQTHLDAEEQQVVPLAAVTLTQEEWNAIGAHSRGSIPKDKLFIAFGMLLEPLSDADRAYSLSEVPAPVKLVWRTLGQRSWRWYARRLRPS